MAWSWGLISVAVLLDDDSINSTSYEPTKFLEHRNTENIFFCFWAKWHMAKEMLTAEHRPAGQGHPPPGTCAILGQGGPGSSSRTPTPSRPRHAGWRRTSLKTIRGAYLHEEDLGRLSRHGCSFRPRGWPVAVRRSRGGGASKQAIARNGRDDKAP